MGVDTPRLWLVMMCSLLSGRVCVWPAQFGNGKWTDALLEGWAKNARAQTEKPDGSFQVVCLWRRRRRKGDS
jgi:hypothetical protein